MLNGVAEIIDKYIKEKWPQDRALGHTGSYSKRQGQIAQQTNPRLSAGKVAMKPVNITSRETKRA
jgi:hypothetical protein